jgi:hypothetical protein
VLQGRFDLEEVLVQYGADKQAVLGSHEVGAMSERQHVSAAARRSRHWNLECQHRHVPTLLPALPVQELPDGCHWLPPPSAALILAPGSGFYEALELATPSVPGLLCRQPDEVPHLLDCLLASYLKVEKLATNTPLSELSPARCGSWEELEELLTHPTRSRAHAHSILVSHHWAEFAHAPAPRSTIFVSDLRSLAEGLQDVAHSGLQRPDSSAPGHNVKRAVAALEKMQEWAQSQSKELSKSLRWALWQTLHLPRGHELVDAAGQEPPPLPHAALMLFKVGTSPVGPAHGRICSLHPLWPSVLTRQPSPQPTPSRALPLRRTATQSPTWQRGATSCFLSCRGCWRWWNRRRPCCRWLTARWASDGQLTQSLP